MKVLIDNGHGVNTPGKCSPDYSLREYAYTRKVALKLYEMLKQNGVDCERITPEEVDVPINTRVRRVNSYCKNENCILVSIHNDAYGADGQWHLGRGWSVFVSLNASRKSKVLASYFAQSAEKSGLKVRRYEPNRDYWQKNLGICRDTNCPAVLTENLFQDNKDDVKYLLSDEGLDNIVTLHFNAIMNFIKDYD